MTVEKSFKFANIENNLLKLLALILNNQNILKYIYYIDSNNPLAESDVTTDLLESENIILTPFDPDVLSENRITMFINPYEGNFGSSSLSDLTYLVDVILPVKKWLLSGLGQIRPMRIFDELSQDIDQRNVMGMKESKITKFKIYKVDNKFAGMSIWIKVNSSSMKGLR